MSNSWNTEAVTQGEFRELNRKLDELRGMVLVLATQLTSLARPAMGGVVVRSAPAPALTKVPQPAEPRVEPEERPYCVRCRKVMRRGRDRGRLQFRCGSCEVKVIAHRIARGLAPRPSTSLTRISASGDELKPSCIRCRRQMHHYRGYGKPAFRCKWCQTETVAHRVARRNQTAQAPLRELAVDNPFCVQCRRKMVSNGKGGARWLCKLCGKGCPKHPTRRRGAHLVTTRLEDHPHCVDCQNPLRRQGSYKGSPMFWCPSCGGHYCCSREARGHRPHLPEERPHCVVDRVPMRCGGAPKGIPRFVCGACGVSCASFKARRVYRRGSRDADGRKLDSFIAQHVPRHYDEEVRAEMRQEIAVDIARKRLRRRDLNDPTTFPVYARRVYRAGRNRFRDLSLEHNIGGGLRLEETLAG